MSRGWRGGSTRAWRKLRAAVLMRDRFTCQVRLDDGRLCERAATTVGHLDRLSQGGTLLAHPSRLRAECPVHNFGDGARLTNAGRRGREWSW
jgi:hypothetical protein